MKFLLSKPDFYSNGLTTASLKLDGKDHSDIDLLMMSVIWGTNTELSYSLSRLVGNSGCDALSDWLNKCFISYKECCQLHSKTNV